MTGGDSPCRGVRDGVEGYVEGLDPGLGIWVAGAGRAARNGATFSLKDPGTGDVICAVADGGELEAVTALDAAEAAFDRWSGTAARDRSEVLLRTFELMRADAELLAALIAWENGKSLHDARAEVHYAAEFFRWFAEEGVRTDGEYGASPAGGVRTIVTHRPVGIAALVTPWNFPAAMATRKIAPALAAGCTMVLKPAQETPLTALAIARMLHAAGAPEGVVNVVPTTDARQVVSRWMQDPRVRAISFTGSTGVGRGLLHQAADRIINASMELGGNAPFVVAADADLESAVAGALIAKFRNGGQACTAANRFFVHESVIDDFTDRFGAAVARLKVGVGRDPLTDIGPLVSEKALEGVRRIVETAVESGARVAYQAPVPPGLAGYFFPPMVLRDVAPGSDILETEIFGPVATVVPWSSHGELLRMVNATEFGLAAYVYSADLSWALHLAESIDAGMVGVNRAVISDPSAPFGGVKQSGIGREGAREGLREFQETQYFSVDWA